jgi:hypothetical protein
MAPPILAVLLKKVELYIAAAADSRAQHSSE